MLTRQLPFWQLRAQHARLQDPSSPVRLETLLRKHRIQTAQQEQSDAFPALRRYMQPNPALQQVRRGGRDRRRSQTIVCSAQLPNLGMQLRRNSGWTRTLKTSVAYKRPFRPQQSECAIAARRFHNKHKR